MTQTPNVRNLAKSFRGASAGPVFAARPSAHRPPHLLLYGSLRARSFSPPLPLKKLQGLPGSEWAPRPVSSTRAVCPLPDAEEAVASRKSRSYGNWRSGLKAMVGCSPERHGADAHMKKPSIDWNYPLSDGGCYAPPRQDASRACRSPGGSPIS